MSKDEVNLISRMEASKIIKNNANHLSVCDRINNECEFPGICVYLYYEGCRKQLTTGTPMPHYGTVRGCIMCRGFVGFCEKCKKEMEQECKEFDRLDKEEPIWYSASFDYIVKRCGFTLRNKDE